MYRVQDDGTIDIVRGDSADFDVVVTQKNDQGEKVIYDLQPGDVVEFTVKKSTKVKDKLISKIGPHISLVPADTEGLEYKKYVYDVQLTLADGFVDTIIQPNTFNVLDEVTW